METKRKDVTEEDIERWVTRWQKLWDSGEYKPWHEVQEVPSQGRSRKITGTKSGRKHHLLSDAEYFVFLLLEHEGSVINIYEQYPLLPRSKTIQIANERGLAHPKYRGVTKRDESTGKRPPLPNKIMTTDFLVEIDRNGERVFVAIPVKTRSGIDPSQKKNKSILQKLEIERQFWLDQGIECYCLVKEDIDTNLIFNLKWFYEDVFLPDQLLECKGHWKEIFKSEIDNCNTASTLKELLDSVSEQLNINCDESVKIFRHLMWHKALKANVYKKILLTSKVKTIDFDFT